MKLALKTVVESDVKTLRAVMGVRYWEDAIVDGVPEEEEAPRIPLRDGDRWVLEIDLDTGRIAGWPAGVMAETHYKVCDDGSYSLLDAGGAEVIRKDGYVPSMLCPLENGYGDYVILKIDGDGLIEGWSADLSFFDTQD